MEINKGFRMKARTFASVAVMGALGLLAPVHSYAFGLGKIELSSALNEPFQAAIPVTALRDEGELRVQLASNLEFEKAGLKRSFLLTQLNFEVVEDEGVTRILISSSQPIKEPFIDFLVTATTGNGRLIREYTVLLDPPKNIFVKPQSTSSTKQKTTVSTKTAYQSPASKTPVTSTSHYSSATSYGPIERTDTLWDIAKDTKPDANISQNQMMMAILNANPESFRNNNINGLKVGGTLDIPTVEVIRELSRSQAFTAVKEQNSVWKNRNKKSEVVSDTIEQEEAPVSLSEEESPEQTESLEPEAIAVEDNGETSGAQLKLLVPTEETLSNEAELSPLGDSQLTQLNDQLSLAQETIEGQVQENVEMKARMEIMEEQIQTLRRLVTLKDADLAVVQSAMQSEVEEYFTQLETNEELSPDSDDELLVDSELLSEENDVEPSSDTELVEQGDTSAQLPLEVAAGTINSALEKLKSFYAENKQESLIAGLLAFLGLLFLSFRSRRNQKYTWDDAVAAADVEESSHRNAKSSVISDSQETPVGEEEEIIKAAYASLGDDELVDTELNFQ
ncbi:MAG: hypothetical protein GQ548_05705 [Methylophaga sp.]|nr:hypothetical protein [Methylophaga sp.]